MRIGDRVRVRAGSMIGYVGRVVRVLTEGDPPRARVEFLYRDDRPSEEWIPIDNLAKVTDAA